MEQSGVKVNMKPEYKLILSALRSHTGTEKILPLEEYLFLNREILESLDLFILEPKKNLERFKDKVLFAYIAKRLSEKQIEQINCVTGIVQSADMYGHTLNFENYLKTNFISSCKGDEALDFFLSKEDLFLAIKVTQ